MPTTLIAAHTTNTNGGNCDELSQQGATQVVSCLPRGYERVAPRACTSSPTGHSQGRKRAPCWVNPSLSGSLRHLERGGQLDLQARPRPLASGQSEGWDQARGRKEVNWDPAFVRAKPLQSVEWTLPDFSDRDFVILKVRSWAFCLIPGNIISVPSWRILCVLEKSKDKLICVTRAPLLYFIRSWVALSF